MHQAVLVSGYNKFDYAFHISILSLVLELESYLCGDSLSQKAILFQVPMQTNTHTQCMTCKSVDPPVN